MKKIIVAERITDEAIELLRENHIVDVELGISREDLLSKIHNYDSIIVRSETQIDEELLEKAINLKMVGRAGNGTDNIDVKGATKRGVIVANTPESNTMSAAELTVALLLTQSRNIPQANGLLKDGKWGRNQFKGSELYQKTIGIIGLGRIGSLVAKRMEAFGMNVIAYDPYITDDRFTRYNVEKKKTIEELIKESDYITVHTPKNKETFWMINESHLPLMKKGVRLANVARGGIIKEQAIIQGITEGIIASAGIDVHESEPSTNMELMKFENVIVTPHLGASTDEAQMNVGMTLAQQVIEGLRGGIVTNAVNLPALHRDEFEALKPFITLAEKLGKLYFQINNEPVELVKVDYYGELAKQDTSLITIALIKGMLETIVSNRVNYINALLIAEDRGISIREKNREEYFNGFTDYIRISFKTKSKAFVLGGNLSSKKEGRLVDFNGFDVDLIPEKFMIALRNVDVPGMIGRVGSVLGENGVNIASMQLGRNLEGDNALMLINVDEEPTEAVLDKLKETDKVLWVKSICL